MHGLGGALPAAVHGGFDAVSQHRQNTELQRDNQFISIAALHQSAGRVRHRDGRRGAAGRADHHGSLGAGIL